VIARLIDWVSTPKSSPNIDKRNFINVQIDGMGVALAGAAAQFLPVYLARMNATPLQISLLTTMPAITGMFLALILGRFLQRQRSVIPWFSGARLTVIMCYALTGIISLIVPMPYVVPAVLVIWAFATLPQTIVNISFSVVMNAVAGPEGRYELMTHRWSILGATTAVTVMIIGQILDRIVFPLNYQIVFIALSVGGLISYYYSSHIRIPPTELIPEEPVHNVLEMVANYTRQVTTEKPFMNFLTKRFVFLTGIAMTAPLFPLYYVRTIQASDSWISAINTSQTIVLIFGYFFWSRQSRRHGSQRVLVLTTLGLALHPIIVAMLTQSWQIAIMAAFAGIFQAGLDLVFFDELMRTVPPEYSATFVAFAQSIQYFSSVVSPIIGSTIAGTFGISTGLIIAGLIRLVGFGLFAFWKRGK
jgi:MFS family permease